MRNLKLIVVTGLLMVFLQSCSNNIVVKDPEFQKCLLKQWDENRDGRISKKEAESIGSIYCRNRNIKSLAGIEQFENLGILDCSDNNLTSLDVSHNTKLSILLCRSNNLTSLDVSHNSDLRELDCRYNNQFYDDKLMSLDVSNNSKLKKLYCGGNNLTSLDVSHNTALEELDCGSNNLTSLDVSQNTALKKLECYGNNLTSLDVSHNTALEELNCAGNSLTSLDLSKNTALEELNCGSNNLTSLDLSKNTALSTLYCSDNNLTSLDVSDALLKLDYSNNPLRLSDLSGNALHALKIQAEVEEIERKYMARGSSSSGNKYSWLRGYWQCATGYGSMYLLIDGEGKISSMDEDGYIEKGTYTVDAENNKLRVQFDNDPKGLITTYKLQNQQIYYGNGLWYYKFAPY